MAEIRIKDNESLESALRRFKKQCARAGVIQEVRKREAYESHPLSARRSPKQLASASTNNKREEAGFCPLFCVNGFFPSNTGGKDRSYGGI